MSITANEYLNINAKPITLSCTKIGSALDGYQFTIKYKNETNNGLVLSIFLPAVFIFLRHFDCDISWYYIISICFLALTSYIESHDVREETVLIIPYLGIQYTTKYGFKMEKNDFIHWQTIDGIIINEVIDMQRVIYILTVMIKDASDQTSLITLFKNTQPKLNCLEFIYQEMLAIIENKKTSATD